MTIFLINLEINSPQNYGYNYGLGYISSVLKKNSYNVDYIALKNKEDILMFYEKVKIKKPEMIGFSVIASQFSYLKDIIKTVKGISNSFIVCGGVHPTLKPECIFEIPELDAIVKGEGEFPLLELAQTFENRENYLQIRNFWFKVKTGVIKNQLRPFIKNLDELPFPDKDSLDYQKVIDESRGINRFIFSRGCIFECAYCSNKALSEVAEGDYFRQRSPQKAIEEIELNERKYKFDFIIIDDDAVSLNKKWFYEFFILYKKKFSYPFRCNLRPGTVDSDMMKLLKECGATNIGIGIEHGNEEFRKTILKRNISNKQIIDIFKLCDKYDMPHTDFIMVGFPFETKELFFDTIKLCRKVSAKGFTYIFHPYPGTELGRICEEHNWLPDKEYFRERQEAVISYPNFKKEEIQLCHDLSLFLIHAKFIPLGIPLKVILYLYKLHEVIVNSKAYKLIVFKLKKCLKLDKKSKLHGNANLTDYVRK